MKICLDPGHGGRDPGAVSGGVRESDLALGYCLALSSRFTSMGHQTILTRMADVDLAPDERDWKVGKGLDLERRALKANLERADVFLSIHANAAAQARANGMWVLHAAHSTRSKALAADLFAELSKIPGIADADAEKEVFPDQSPATNARRLRVLNATNMPAALIELGFLTNPEDVQQLMSRDALDRVCGAITTGTVNWSKRS